MKNKGTTLCYYMLSGEAKGCIKCSSKVWSAISYKVPRAVAKNCSHIKELQGSGIYLLFGIDENDVRTVYVGQAGVRKNGDGLLRRMLDNHPSANDWTEAIVLTSKGNELGASELCYLEHQFYRKAKESGRYKVLNGCEPRKGELSEEDESDMYTYIDYADIMVAALGSKVFTPMETAEEAQEEPELYFSGKAGSATGRYLADGFIVYRGSKISSVIAPKSTDKVLRVRAPHESKIIDGVLTEDVLLTSPSAAVLFIGGYHRSGWDAWKTSEGLTLTEYEASKVGE